MLLAHAHVAEDRRLCVSYLHSLPAQVVDWELFLEGRNTKA
jgi:hypothetical protein